jgi:hypothetical protein
MRLPWQDGIERLILGAGGDILFGQCREKPFQFLLAWGYEPEV